MTMRINRDAYQRLIDEDIEWLMKQPRTLERDHVKIVLEQSVSCYYGFDGGDLQTENERLRDVIQDVLCDPGCVHLSEYTSKKAQAARGKTVATNANIRAINAELLAACESVVECFTNPDDEWDCIETAKAAVAKAKGQPVSPMPEGACLACGNLDCTCEPLTIDPELLSKLRKKYSPDCDDRDDQGEVPNGMENKVSSIQREATGIETLELADCPCCCGDMKVGDYGYSSLNPGWARCEGECRREWRFDHVDDEWDAGVQWNKRASTIKKNLQVFGLLMVKRQNSTSRDYSLEDLESEAEEMLKRLEKTIIDSI